MSLGRASRLAWFPPFLVGAAAAIAAEVAIGILLYADAGLMRSLSTVLVIELAAFGVGLWAAPAHSDDVIDRIRRCWLFCLLAFVAAAAFGTSWTVVREMGSGAMGQGIGLALLAALPLYGCGSVLGGMATVSAHAVGGPAPGPGAPAAVGAAVGFAATGLLLPRSPMPSSLLIACLVLLSMGGLVYGIVLSGRSHVRVRAARDGPAGPVRVEDRRGGDEGAGARVLVEGTSVRRRVEIGEAGTDPWDVSLARALMPDPQRPWRVLMLGGGASALPRAVVREHPTALVEVLERTRAVVDLARDHFDTGIGADGTDRALVRVGNLDDLVDSTEGTFDLVVIDASALAPVGDSSGLSARTRARLVEQVSLEGALAWGPRGATMDGTPAWPTVELSRSLTDRVEEIVVASRGPLEPVAAGFADFVVRDGGALPT